MGYEGAAPRRLFGPRLGEQPGLELRHVASVGWRGLHADMTYLMATRLRGGLAKLGAAVTCALVCATASSPALTAAAAAPKPPAPQRSAAALPHSLAHAPRLKKPRTSSP